MEYDNDTTVTTPPEITIGKNELQWLWFPAFAEKSPYVWQSKELSMGHDHDISIFFYLIFIFVLLLSCANRDSAASFVVHVEVRC